MGIIKKIISVLLIAVIMLSTLSGCRKNVGAETRTYNKIIRGFQNAIPRINVYTNDLIDEAVENKELINVDTENAVFYVKDGESTEEKLKNNVLFIISFYLVNKILKEPLYGDGEMSYEDFCSAYEQILYYDKSCMEFDIWFMSVISTAKKENQAFDPAKATSMAEMFEAKRELHPETNSEDLEPFFEDWDWFSQTTCNLEFQALLYALAGEREEADKRNDMSLQIRDSFHREILEREKVDSIDS